MEDAPGRLSEWQRFLEGGLERELGLAPEGRPFRPHVTAAYARDRKPGDRQLVQAAVERLGDLVPAEAETLSRIVLFKSELAPQGAVHTPICSVELSES